MSDAAKVKQFLQFTKVATRNEIAGGTGLSRESTDAALAAVVASGEVLKVGEANTATYLLASGMPVDAPAEPTDLRSSEQVWSDTQRVRALTEWRRMYPEEVAPPPKRYEPSDEEIEAFAAAQKVTPLTEAQRRELELMTKNRTPRNPQQFLR